MMSTTRPLFSVGHIPSPTQRLVTSLDFSPCGGYLASASEDDLLRIIATSGDTAAQVPGCSNDEAGGGADQPGVLATYYFESMGVKHVCYGPSESSHVYLAPRTRSASDVLRFDLATGVVDGAFHVLEKDSVDDDSDFSTLVHSPSADVFSAAKVDGFVSFFHPSSSQAIASLDRPAEGSPVCAWSADGQRFTMADRWCLATYDWRALARGPVTTHDPMRIDRDGFIHGIQFRPKDPDTLLVTTTNMIVSTLNIADQTAAPVPIFEDRDEVHDELAVLNLRYIAYKRRLYCTARYDPTGTMIAVGTAASALLLLDADGKTAPDSDAAKGRERPTLTHKAAKCHKATITNVAWNPRSNLLASACQHVNLWTVPLDGGSATRCAQSAAEVSVAATPDSDDDDAATVEV